MDIKTPEGPILVTGAGGCVGRMAVDLLVSAGVRVRGADRPGVDPPLDHDLLEWVAADLTQSASIPPLVEGVRGIVHTAALVDIGQPWERHAPINWIAVRDLYNAACDAGVERFVHFSTGSLYRPKQDGSAWREDDPLYPVNAYARSKLLAEDFLCSRIGDGPRVTILRPGLIYGPNGKVLIASLAPAADMLRSLPLPVKLRGGPRTNLVHSRDMARAALFLLTDDHEDGEAFNVASEDVIDVGEMVHVAMTTAGARGGLLPVPYPTALMRRVVVPVLDRPGPLFRVINTLTDALWSGFRWRSGIGPHLSPHVDREALPFAAVTAILDVSKLAGRGFTWQFPTFRAGWEETVGWYRSHGWLPAA